MTSLSQHKLSIALGVVLLAFVIATIVVAIQKSDLQNDLDECQKKLNDKTTTVDPSTSTPSTTVTEDPTTTEEPKPETSYRLPTSIVPLNYDLYLHPDLKTHKFTGDVKIGFSVQDEATNHIVLHSNNLTIGEVKVRMTKRDVKVKSWTFDTEKEFLIIEVTELLSPEQEYVLSIKFEGDMQNKIVGLYSSKYVNENEDRWMATSKFEPTYARQAFPCFDEPEMKAKFKITLVRPQEKGYIALSNMDILSEKTIEENNVAVTFKESVAMSTYLACFIVSDFVHLEKTVNTNEIGEPFSMRVYATPAQKNKVQFALDTGVKVVEYYIQYFNIPYPLPKLDMAAIPDFVSGAMEHWGLVTFRETSLLYDEKISSSSNKQRIGSTIAHELAHMWFGNLVTMKWWNDLWLNEGFATYMQYKGLNVAEPTWKMLDQFLVEGMHGVMKLDGTLASHPIVQTVETPDQITELFDSITYQKGASIIRMLEQFVGEDKFQKAVTSYLNKYKYSNAVTEDLLNEIQALLPDYEIKYMMQNWTENMGLPVVEVSVLKEADEQVTYQLTQKRFFANPEDEEEHKDSPLNYKWYIPITYQYASPTNKKLEKKSLIFKNTADQVLVDVPKGAKWLKFNVNQVGYYRVNYAETLWKNIIAQLTGTEKSLYSDADRAHLLNDAFSLADAEQLPYETALDLTMYLKQETEYVPWIVAASKIISLKNNLYYTNAYEQFVKYGKTVVKTAYENLGWEAKEHVAEDHLNNLLRVTITDAACEFELPDCIAEATKRFKAWIDKPTDILHPDIRDIVYNYGMAHAGDDEIWTQVWERYKSESDASEKTKLMEGLAAIREPWILRKFIGLAWDEKNVRSQDYFSCIKSIAANRLGESIVWDYVRENWEMLVDRFGLNERYLGRLIPSITSRFSTNVKLQEMKEFFAENPEAGAGTAARKEALANVENNIKWVESNKDKINAWLKKQ